MVELALQVEKDESFHVIINGVNKGEKEFEECSVENGVLFKDRRLVVPAKSPFIPRC